MSKLHHILLVVDDDNNFSAAVKEFLASDQLEVITVNTAAECVATCAKLKVDVALLDQKLPDQEGHTICSEILRFNEQTKIIFPTAYPSFENAVNAIRAGAYDYLSKPYELEELRLALTRALRTLDLEKVEQLQQYNNARDIEDSILIGKTGGLSEVQKLLELASKAEAPVLITGETGTGKNIAARNIHYNGPNRTAPFISINCAAIAENLIEAELFGYEKGSFTGAVTARKGIFEMAEDGTLFLDEIGEMPFHLQSKLLGVLDDKKIKRIGGASTRYINFRLLTATSVNLEDAVRNRKFRDDLYYRLNVIKIHMPPLRARKNDLKELAQHLITKFSAGKGRTISAEELEKLKAYDWPGNIRELRNIIERAIILQNSSEIRPSELLFKSSSAPIPLPSTDLSVSAGSKLNLCELEKKHIAEMLGVFSGNLAQTSRALGISLSTLKRKLKTFDISTSSRSK